MKQIGVTAAELSKYLIKEIKAGHGDYKIFVTDDEEANGYHALWYLGQTALEIESSDGKEIREHVEDSNYDISILEDEKDKAIYLG